MNRTRLHAALLAAALTLAGCQGTEGSDPTPETTTPATEETMTSPPAEDPTAPTPASTTDGEGTAQPGAAVDGETPAGQMTAFVLDLLERAEDVTAADFEGQLAPVLIAAIPADELAAVLNTSVRPTGPFRVTAYRGTQEAAITTIEPAVGDPLDLQIAVDEDGLLTGIYFTPAAAAHEPATSMGEVDERLAALPLDVRALITLAPRGGTPEVLVSQRPDDAAPLASIFKLYVLLAVAEAVADGEVTWDEQVEVPTSLYSLPAGEFEGQDSASVRELATAMISVSDNTATDVLMDRVGRDAVEAAVEASGHADPALVRPFTTTRELFQIGWGGEGRSEAWAAADEAGRRAMLEVLAGEPVPGLDEGGDDSVWDKGVDWFASPEDIVRAYEALDSVGDPVVREILSVNPGVGLEFDHSAWPLIEFKGGGSVGVLTGAWRAERADGALLTLVVLTATTDAATSMLSQREVFGLVEDTFRIAAEL